MEFKQTTFLKPYIECRKQMSQYQNIKMPNQQTMLYLINQ